MGSPTVFTGSRTKFISSKGALLKDGSVIDNDGVPNFIKNGHAEIDTTGWATYADAAQSTPVDGTGGVANVTWTRSTTTPLAGAGSFIFTKDTSNRQGQGVSYTFSVDPAFRAKVCNIQFDYIFTSINGSFDTSNPNLTVYIYDVTNSTLIQPSSYGFASNSQTIPDTFQASFQTSATGASYRLIFHVATVSTSGYTLKFDNIQVTPTQYAFGTPVTDWVSWTPTISGLGTGSTSSVSGKWRRVGDSIHIDCSFTKDGSNGSGSAAVSITIPSGLTFDTNKMAASAGSEMGSLFTSNATLSASSLSCYADGTGTANKILMLSGSSLINGSNVLSGNTFVFTMMAPILGWSSSVQTSDQTSTRVIAARAYRNAAQTVTTTAAKISFDVVNFDDVGGWSGGTYTVKVPGKYRIKLVTCVDGVAVDLFHQPSIYIDGVTQATMFHTYSNGNTYSSGITELLWNCVAGTTIEGWIRNNLNSRGLVTGSTLTYMEVERLAGPNQIAASETVSALYTGAPPTGTLTNSWNTATFGTKIKDSHGAYSGGSYTIPVSGQYDISAALAINATYTTGQIAGVSIYIDGVEKYINVLILPATTTISYPNLSINSIPLTAGQVITIRSYTTGSSASFSSGSVGNFFSINKSGNY